MRVDRLQFSRHAIRQMFARRISTPEVRHAIEHGQAIAHYPDDRPYASRLILAWVEGRPLHIVLAYDDQTRSGYVITAYEPDPDIWTDDFRQRRTP